MAPVCVDALPIVDVQVPSDGSAHHRFVRAGREHVSAGGLAKIRPTLVAVVDVVEVEPGFNQELGEPDVWPLTPKRPKLVNLRRPARGDRLSQAPQHDL